MSETEKAFLRFASYGKASTTRMDMTARNFNKMCWECGVIDQKNVNSNDVDLAFNKVRSKGAHTISYVQFLQAMKVLCRKRFSGKLPEDALQATLKLLEGKEPASVQAAASAMAGGVERLTAIDKPLNSHKQNFDKSRKDEGTAGHSNLALSTRDVANDKGSGT